MGNVYIRKYCGKCTRERYNECLLHKVRHGQQNKKQSVAIQMKTGRDPALNLPKINLIALDYKSRYLQIVYAKQYKNKT